MASRTITVSARIAGDRETVQVIVYRAVTAWCISWETTRANAA